MSRLRPAQLSPGGLADGPVSVVSGSWSTARPTDGLRLPVLGAPPAQPSSGALWVDNATGALWIQAADGPIQCPAWHSGQAALAEMGADSTDVTLGPSWTTLAHPVTLASAGTFPAIYWDGGNSILRSNYDATMLIVWTVPFQWSAADVIDDQGVLVSFRILVDGTQIGTTGEFLAVPDGDTGPPPKIFSAHTAVTAVVSSQSTIECQAMADRGSVKAIGTTTSGATMQRRVAALRLS